MKFEWDDKKRAKVLSEHGLDFAEVARTFRGPRIADFDWAHSESEDRWRMLGFLDGKVICVVYAQRGETVRLITARIANSEETQLFYEEFFGESL